MDIGKPVPGTRIIPGPYDTAPEPLTARDSWEALRAEEAKAWRKTDSALAGLLGLIALLTLLAAPALLIALYQEVL